MTSLRWRGQPQRPMDFEKVDVQHVANAEAAAKSDSDGLDISEDKVSDDGHKEEEQHG